MAFHFNRNYTENFTWALLNDSDYTGNNTYLYEDFGNNADLLEYYNRIQKLTALCGIVLTVLTIVINSAVIYCCLKDQVLRSKAFYIQIVNFSASHLTVSIFVLPFTVYSILYPWTLGSTMCKIWVLFDIMIPFTSLIILLILNIDRILFMSHPNAYSCIFRKCATTIYLTPWIVSLVIVAPLWISGTLPHEHIVGKCIVIVAQETAILCHIITFFIPLFTLIILTLEMLVLKLKYSNRVNRSSSTERLSLKNTSVNTVVEEGIDDGNEVHAHVTRNRNERPANCPVASICMVNFFFVAMWFPYQVISFRLTICDSQLCMPSLEMNQVVTWLGTSTAAVTPLIWIIDDTFRQGLKNMCSCRIKEPVKTSSTSEETFL